MKVSILVIMEFSLKLGGGAIMDIAVGEFQSLL